MLGLLQTDLPLPEILNHVLSTVERLTGAAASALFLVDPATRQVTQLIQRGDANIPFPDFETGAPNSAAALGELPYLELIVQGNRIGWLALAGLKQVHESQFALAKTLTSFAALVVDSHQQRTYHNQQQSRVSQLSHLHNLIMSGSSLDEVLRTIAREIALHLGADCTLGMIRTSEQGMQFSLRGCYGFSPSVMNSKFSLEHTSLGRAFKVGGLGTIPDLSLHSRHGLMILREHGIRSVHWCCIEGQSELLGALVVGFKTDRVLSDFEWTLLEECSQGAAIAVVIDENRRRIDEYSTNLEHIVLDRTEELSALRSRADQENQAKSRFVADMSHELRTPLTAIVGYSSVIARGVFGEVSDAQRDALLSVTRAAEHLKDLLNEVLQIAKVEAGREQLAPSSIEIGSLVKQVTRMMLQAANTKNIGLMGLNDDSAAKKLKIWVDQRHGRQILLNLISNAIKYTHPGGTVQVAAEVVADKVKISVTDTGVGIPETEIGSVFERFTRGTHCYSQSQLGTGLGLPLTKELVEANGGAIGVESKPGEGSTFWVMLPLSDEEMEELDASAVLKTQPVTRLDGLQILVVDDSKLTCELLQIFIRQLGGVPLVATSVKDALDLVQFTQFDAVLVDLAFPGESGLAVIDYFVEANQRTTVSVPIIAISANVLDEARTEALNRGASAFIAKPFDPAEVAYWIRTLVTSSTLSTESHL